MRLLPRAVAERPVHLVLGSASDVAVGRTVLAILEKRDLRSVPVHILSCHRNPAEVPKFAKEFAGKAVVCLGGMSFQLPAILDSWFREYDKRVAVFGIPVGDSPEKLEMAVLAMRDLPSPCEVHWVEDNSNSSISEIAEQVVALLNGKPPVGVTKTGWKGRVRKHREWKPRFNVSLEEV